MRPTPEQIECAYTLRDRGADLRAGEYEAIDALLSLARTFDPQSVAERTRDAIAEHVGKDALGGSYDAWFKGRCESLKITVLPDGKVEVT